MSLDELFSGLTDKEKQSRIVDLAVLFAEIDGGLCRDVAKKTDNLIHTLHGCTDKEHPVWHRKGVGGGHRFVCLFKIHIDTLNRLGASLKNFRGETAAWVGGKDIVLEHKVLNFMAEYETDTEISDLYLRALLSQFEYVYGNKKE